MPVDHFVDPRREPEPPAPPRAKGFDPDLLRDLDRLIRTGQLYEVERWIMRGLPLQLDRTVDMSGRPRPSALQAALRANNQALLLLLLANGYDPNYEADSPINLALELRQRDHLQMLLDWGADPLAASLSLLFDTYDTSLFEYFREQGLDVSAGCEMAHALGLHTSNKPLLGFARRHRCENPRIQRHLDIALVEHAYEGREKGTLLCLWAGANPYASVPAFCLGRAREFDIFDDEDGGWNAIEAACAGGNVALLEKLRFDASAVNMESLFRCAKNHHTRAFLARHGEITAPGPIIWSMLSRLPLSRYPSIWELERLFDLGARWTTCSMDEVAGVRRELLRLGDETFVSALKLLTARDNCSDPVLEELARTDSFRRRLKRVGISPGRPSGNHEPRTAPHGARHIRSRLGLPEPKQLPPPKHRSRVLEIGSRYGAKEKVRTTRAELMRAVWAEPVEVVAKRWGLSGRGLAKACSRAHVPTPPRGYWARVGAGQSPRRPRLPKIREGEVEEIIIYLPSPRPTPPSPDPEEQ